MYLSAEEGRVRHLLLTKPNWHWNVFPMPYYENIGIADKKTVQYPLDLYTNFTFNAHVKGQFHSIILGVLSRHTKWHFKNFLAEFSLSKLLYLPVLPSHSEGGEGHGCMVQCKPTPLSCNLSPLPPLDVHHPLCRQGRGERCVLHLPWLAAMGEQWPETGSIPS